jgi:hypothetical protein
MGRVSFCICGDQYCDDAMILIVADEVTLVKQKDPRVSLLYID